ncbi:pentapeptide repeat-containing protein [Microcoleus sp. FACHB-831]|uniref:serine/threonine-protein kinase n=1 Tax=Microcoleus sp. FACHB-831 TaxID=2692827 RepID=UPI0016863107|nr:serine/threonine-protein kinase [Microcoleus sp. FACHB-831]MBD1922319.1 pentapeptide repeat-containing protein [Microcoleus sp. FACHB-831]
MSYCLNPACPNPQNPTDTEICRACNSKILLRDRYKVIRSLGQGGFGATFLAQDEGLPGEPCCVIKQLRPSTTAPQVLEMARELFAREARTLGKIGNHPQVPRLLDYFEDSQQFYLVQEYISGYTLQQEIKRDGPMSEAGVKQFLSEIIPVLEYIHSQQVIHRDIKPANMIRREQDRKLVLIDFGAVKNQVSQGGASSNSDQTALTAYAIGTPGFAPPEQMAMRPVYASDIYAVGVTCIYLLTGKSPKELEYDPKTGEMLWKKQVYISDHFADVMKKMLEVSVAHRFQCAEEVLRALDLEPYLDSLEQGLATKSKPSIRNPGYRQFHSGDLGPQTSPNANSSASSRLAQAAAIRARRAKMENTGTPQMHNGAGSGAFIGRNPTTSTLKNSNSSGKPKGPIKLDAPGVITAYAKGRRDFAQMDLSLLNLEKANLSGSIFHQTKLVKTNLQAADLANADFGRASLSKAILRDANLGRAYFNQADLEGADLRGADLSYAYLSNANIRGANLCGANLSNAKITEEQLATAKTNWATVLPSGKRGFW